MRSFYISQQANGYTVQVTEDFNSQTYVARKLSGIFKIIKDVDATPENIPPVAEGRDFFGRDAMVSPF